jgi:hypothetical protein
MCLGHVDGGRWQGNAGMPIAFFIVATKLHACFTDGVVWRKLGWGVPKM